MIIIISSGAVAVNCIKLNAKVVSFGQSFLVGTTAATTATVVPAATEGSCRCPQKDLSGHISVAAVSQDWPPFYQLAVSRPEPLAAAADNKWKAKQKTTKCPEGYEREPS